MEQLNASERSELIYNLGEAFHAAFRRAADSPIATRIYKDINNLDRHEWSSILSFVADAVEHQMKSSGPEVWTRQQVEQEAKHRVAERIKKLTGDEVEAVCFAESYSLEISAALMGVKIAPSP